MDVEYTPEQRRSRRLQIGRRWIIASIVAVAAGAWASRQFTPSLERSELNIAVVETGPIEAVISTNGTVIPSAQETISSPVAAEVRKVLVSLGETVEQGQVLLELDKTAAELALSNLQQELALKKEELRSSDLQLSDTLRESRSRRDLLSIDLEARSVRLERIEKLGKSGIVSAQEMLEARLDVKRTQIELQQVTAQVESVGERRQAEQQRLRLVCSILEKQVADQARRVSLAAVVAPRNGVVTHLVDRIGTSVTEGQTLVTVAGQESFRVEATLSDFYAPQLKSGLRVNVRPPSNEILLGKLVRVVPAATGPQIVLYVELDDPSSRALRANARVNVDVVTAEKPMGLRVRRGSALDSSGVHEVYVVDGHKAVRTKIRTGLSSSQDIEIADGAKAGDQVIISDMSAYRAAELTIR